MTRRLVVILALATVIFLIAADPGRATIVANHVVASLQDIGGGFGDFIKSLG